LLPPTDLVFPQSPPRSRLSSLSSQFLVLLIALRLPSSHSLRRLLPHLPAPLAASEARQSPPPSSTSLRCSPGRPSALPCPLIPLASPSPPTLPRSPIPRAIAPSVPVPSPVLPSPRDCPRRLPPSFPQALARLLHPQSSLSSCYTRGPLVTHAIFPFPSCPPWLSLPPLITPPSPPSIVVASMVLPVARGPRSCLSSRAWSSLPPLLVPPHYATGTSR
jgi:hypothetical protein